MTRSRVSIGRFYIRKALRTRVVGRSTECRRNSHREMATGYSRRHRTADREHLPTLSTWCCLYMGVKEIDHGDGAGGGWAAESIRTLAADREVNDRSTLTRCAVPECRLSWVKSRPTVSREIPFLYFDRSIPFISFLRLPQTSCLLHRRFPLGYSSGTRAQKRIRTSNKTLI